jgi:hypothetical protein
MNDPTPTQTDAETLKREQAIAGQIDDHLETDAYNANVASHGVRLALFILIVRTLTSGGWSVERLCNDVRKAAVPDQRPKGAVQ